MYEAREALITIFIPKTPQIVFSLKQTSPTQLEMLAM